MKKLNGRVAVVTGAGSGIGRALAMVLAERGCDLALSDIDSQALGATADRVEQTGRKVSLHTLDVSDRVAMEALPAAVLEEHGRLDIMINNAGVAVSDLASTISLEDFEWIVGINFWGVVYGTRFVLPHMLQQGEGHLVNISSVFGLIGVPSQSAYCATKFAVRGFTESVRAEMGGTGVGVTSVHPGGVATNIARNARFVRGYVVDEELDQTEAVARFDELARTTPEAAAEQIVAGIERNRPRVVIGADARFLDRLQRLMPVRYQAVLRRLLK